jgi:uncharacterized tellurite resistance protein B-like protein
MDQATREMVCRLIAGIVVVDDHLDDKEDEFVDRLLIHFGLVPEDRSMLFPIMDDDEAAEQLAGLTNDVQQQALSLLIEAAAADEDYVEAEQEYLHTIAKALGVAPTEVDQRVQDLIDKK